MIPRYQRVLYWLLLLAIVAVAALLIRGRQRTDRRLHGSRDESPIAAPSSSPPEPALIASASDDDGTIALDQVTLALPSDASLRARALLLQMFGDFASSGSLHPVPAMPAVHDVFFVPFPMLAARSPGEPAFPKDHPHPGALSERALPFVSPYGLSHPAGSELAVVNLSGAFADAHTSGIEAELLTLQAVVATLQANFPRVDEVLFLVDGEPRSTLNGHADLSRPYPVADPAKAIHVLSQHGTPK